MKRIITIITVASFILVGAGCKNGTTAETTNGNTLRQPAPPAAPQKNPEIPPEAKNIPKPY